MVVWQVQKPWLKQNQPYRANFPLSGFSGGKGKGQGPARKAPPSVPANYQVDVNARYFGTVIFYHKYRGYGFIEPTEAEIPTEKVFVHWKQISSDDRFPILVKGLEVEFSLMTWKDWQRGLNTLRANHVTLVGGLNVALQDELDANEKMFVGGQHLRYTGTLKFYSPRHSFGYVLMDQGYDVDASVPSELRVDHEEVNAAGQQPVHMRNILVEFGIYRNPRGQYKVYNMTLQGGHPLTQDALENRVSMGVGTYRGFIAFWNWRQGYGFIRPEPSCLLPEKVLAKLAEQAEAARQRGKRIAEDTLLYFRKPDVQPGLNPMQGAKVGFQVYIDDKGAGACETTSPQRSERSPAATHCRPSGAVTHRGPLMNSWTGDGAMPSPRTPRQSERFTVGLAMNELQRQVSEDRGRVQRQMDSLERRLQEHITAPATRERWADLQGSVSGLLEEVANLVRRVEGLDEKLRIRTSSCEELLRQRSRELEQQLHGQQQKVQLAVSTFEEMSKRQTSKLRKLVTGSEDHARKLSSLEDLTRKMQAQMGPTAPLETIQARLSELEGQQASLEEEFRHVTASTVAQAISPRHAPPEDYEMARLLESELAKLSKQLATQLDEHSAALANLRVRSESQEQRLSAAGDRMEKLVAPTMEALRGEMHQLRAAERAETDSQLDHVRRQLKDFAEANEELQASFGDQALGLQLEMQQLREDQLQRLMTYGQIQGLRPPENEEDDFSDLLFRVEGLENRMDSFNQDAMTEKADRSEIHRLDVAFEELQQPLRRLSQRTASNEARTTGLEHRLEQFQEKIAASGADRNASNEQAPQDTFQVSDISARLMELEELLPQLIVPRSSEPKEVLERLQRLEGANASDAMLPTEVRAQLDEVSDMASKALKTAENSASNMQALRFDLVVEQERVAKLNKDLQNLCNSFREEQGKTQRTTERQEDQEQKTNEAMQKMLASIEKVQGLHHGYEGGTVALNKLVESIAKRMEAAEGTLESLSGNLMASEVHMLRDSIKADLLELQDERFKDFDQRLASKGSPASDPPKDASKAVDDSTLRRVEELELRFEKVEDAEKKVSLKIAKIDSSAEGLRKDLDDALQRVEAGEDASKAVREELMAEDSEAVTLARTCQNDLKGVHSDVADLQASLRKLASRMEATNPPLRPLQTSALESRVQELQKQVSEELEQLAKQQQLISKVGLKGKIDTQELEKSINNLATQVSLELTELRAHQGELHQVQQMVKGTKVNPSGSSEVITTKVQELQSQVVAEVDALAQQQADLGKAKVTMSELSERVRQAVQTANECKQATSSLEHRLNSLSSEEVCPKCGTRYLAEANFCRKCGHQKPSQPHEGEAQAVDSSAKPQVTTEESDESYADEFEVDEMSVSERLSK